MGDVEEPRFNSLAERIAALNQQKNFTAPSTKRPPPPPPPNRPASRTPGEAQAAASPSVNGNSQNATPTIPSRPAKKVPPALPSRSQTENDVGHASPPARALAPPLPRRETEQSQSSPALPPRRPSTQSLVVARRPSTESVRSYVSTISSLSLNNTASSATSPGSNENRKLPPPLEHAKLPPLPPTRREREAAQAKENEDARAATTAKITNPPLLPKRSMPALPARNGDARPSQPPMLPSRPVRSPGIEEVEEPAPSLPLRRLPPAPTKFVRTIPEVSGSTAGGTPADPSTVAPPPVPIASRPSAARIEAAIRKPAAEQGNSCLVCRDFSEPDGVAAQYPSSVVDRGDPVGYLAHVLCSPFPSATDKARAIFTWCHHNIDYDVQGFFAGCPARGTASDTIFSGKAVCEGYARVFEAIAKRAGLECIVVGGHGKGFGFAPVKDGQPPPPRNPTGHAWNAVRIDNGHWKLTDPCWGAGHIDSQARTYKRKFSPEQFTMSNELFGWRHFPQDSRYFFRDDARTPSWEEYVMGPTGGERARWYGNTLEEGISEWNSSPAQKSIPVYSGEMVRFQFAKLCEHWTAERNGRGKPRLLMMNIHGVDGRKDDQVPLDSDGFWWWCDIPARQVFISLSPPFSSFFSSSFPWLWTVILWFGEAMNANWTFCRDLGSPGQKIQLYGLNVFNGQDARGVTKQHFLAQKATGCYSMSWVSIAEWELV